MAIIDVEVRHDNTDITSSVIEYNREQSICTGVGSLTLTLVRSTAPTIIPWDVIKLYEEGDQRGKYRVVAITDNTKGQRLLECQDESLRLTDYFITNHYFIDYPTYTSTWITKFLEEAGVSYNYKVGIGLGSLINENSSLGLASAYDTIMNLLQQSSWYMYFDNNGTCQIGDLAKDFGRPELSVDEDNIITLTQTVDDSFLRNRAVVWGNANQDKEWVLADIRRPTPWDRDANDIRTVLYSSSNINSSTTAATICYKMLDEFAKLKDEKVIQLIGAQDTEIGDVVAIEHRLWSGKGLLTTLRSSLSSKGLTTEIVLDEKCPRLLGYFSFTDWVYTAHNSNGVWRKEIGGSTWEDFSAGLLNLQVVDLIIKGGVFACVAGNDLYRRTSSSSLSEWYLVSPPMFVGQDSLNYESTAFDCVACDIDTYTHNILAGFKFNDLTATALGYQRYFILEVTALGTVVDQYQVYFVDSAGTAYEDFEGVDIAKYDTNEKLPTAIAPASYGIIDNPEALFGTRKSLPNESPDPNSFIFGPLPGLVDGAGPTVEKLSPVYAGGNVCWENNLGISLNKYDEFFLFNYKKYPDIPFSFKTQDLSGMPLYWPAEGVNSRRLIKRYTYWDGLTGDDSDGIQILDWTMAANSNEYDTVAINLGGLKDYDNPYLEFYPYISTSNVTASGIQVVDGHTTATGDVIFLKDQTDPIDNGVYISGPNAWIRNPTWTAETGLIVQATRGVTNFHRCFQLVLDVDVTTITLDTTELNFEEVLQVNSTSMSNAINIGTESNGVWGAPVNGRTIYDPVFLHNNMYLIYKMPTPDSTLREGTIIYYGVVANVGGGILKVIMDTYPYNVDPHENLHKNWGELGTIATGQGAGIVGVRQHDSSLILYKYILESGGFRKEEATIFDTEPLINCGACSYNKIVGEHTAPILRMAYVGQAITGDIIETYFRITLDSRSNYYNSTCLPCGVWGGHYMRKAAIIRGTLFSNSLDIESHGTEYTDLSCRDCRPGSSSTYCCTTNAPQGSIDLSGDISYSSILSLVNRFGPVYLYGGAQIRSGIDDSVVYTLSRYVDGSMICRQLDDYDGSVYYVVPRENKIYKEGGVPLIEITNPNPGGLIYGTQVYANGTFMITQFLDGPQGLTSLWVLDKDFILNGLELCYLSENLKDSEGEDTGSFKIRDFDFYGFTTEDSQSEPLISWTFPPLITTISGVTVRWPENVKIHRKVNQFKGVPVSGMFNDGRTMLFTGTTASGVELEYDIYALLADRITDLVIMNTTVVSGYTTFATMSGVPFSVETTNMGYDPYIFAGLSPAAFYQKDAYENNFTQYAGHPTSDIMSIRVDDRL